MAYAAVTSLKKTIQHLLNSHRVLVDSSRKKILQQVLETVTNLQSSLASGVDLLEGKIIEGACKLEDVLEFHLSDQFLQQDKSLGGETHPLLFCLDEQDLLKEIRSFTRVLDNIFPGKIDNQLAEEEEDDDAAENDDDDGGGAKMVGLSDEFTQIKSRLLQRMRPDDWCVFSIFGMAGTGRTVIASTIFEDLYVCQEQIFDCGAWVTIGPNYQLTEILASILAQIDPTVNYTLLSSEGDEMELGEYLYSSLTGMRYMIVLDDIRDTHIWDLLRSSFPEQNNGSLVLLTTGVEEVVAPFSQSSDIYDISTMTEDECWEVLRLAIFDVESCPPEFEEAGKKIAMNCQCLPVVVAKVILFLEKVEKTPECWNKLAADKENSIFKIVDDEKSEIWKIKKDMQQYYDERSLIFRLATNMTSYPTMTRSIKMRMFPERFFVKMEIISFFGMAGVGKTTLVKEIFGDPSILTCFDYRAWVTLGTKYQTEEILVDILAQMYPDIDKMHMKGDVQLVKDLCAQVSNKRCLIVFDDVWNKDALHYLKELFPEIKGEVLVTTRIAQVAQFGKCDIVLEMRLLNTEESWCLLRQKVFGIEICPSELDKVGKKIAENCEGLPLTIVMVAKLLSKAEKSLEYWNQVAEKKIPIFMNAHNKMSKVLLPSFMNLPQHLKACFLYMGVFSQNYEISHSKLIELWIAEGFLESNPSQTIEDFAIECLLELVNQSLVMVCQNGSNFKIKTCRLHSAFWHLSNNEAMKQKFFHALKWYVDNSTNEVISQRRLCIRNSILLGIKYVHNLLASNSAARSLLCTGPSHQYSVPIYLGLRLLRVLDAHTIRFYEFPNEVLKLIHLRYLALTWDGKLPASISKLWFLQYLIVRRHLSIKSSKDFSYLPATIWNMKELKHLQVTGSSLPNPDCDAHLPNLITLLDVSAHNCTKDVLNGIPNLKRLRIQIELAPNDDGKSPSNCLDHISCLTGLESLKCVVVNPELRSEVVVPPAPVSMFPSGLKKLSLSGLGYPWGYMSIIGSLPNLEVLKLRCYAFRGPEWETGDFHFTKLKFLLIEDTDLVRFKSKLYSMRKLQCLIIKHCYKLEELPTYWFSNQIIVVDSNPSAVTWAKTMGDNISSHELCTCSYHVHSSWDVGSLKL